MSQNQNKNHEFDKYSSLYDYYMRALRLYKKKEILQALSLNGSEKILDVGGGTGYLANCFGKHCKEIHVLDNCAQMLKKAERYQGVTTILQDALKIGSIKTRYDLVLLADVLHHIPEENHLKIMQNIERVLDREGRLVIFDFNLNTLRGKLIQKMESLLFEKVYFEKPEYVETLLDSIKFSIIEKLEKSYWYLIVGKKGSENEAK